ncbi:MAG: hypothetical protein WCJ33_05170, partial [Pseudomonadota bacterium]
YIVLASILWFIITIFIKAKKEKQAPRYIILSLIILLTLSAIGPWNMEAISVKSQYSQLVNILEKNNLLENGKIKPSKNKISFHDRKEISSKLYYLSKKNNWKEILQPLFVDELGKNMDWGRYQSAEKLTEMIGFKYIYSYKYPGSNNESENEEKEKFNISNYYDFHEKGLIVSGYDFILRRNIDLNKNEYINLDLGEGKQKLNFSAIIENNIINITDKSDSKKLLIDLPKVISVEELRDVKNSKGKIFTAEVENEKDAIILLINSVSGEFLQEDKVKFDNLTADILIKVK